MTETDVRPPLLIPSDNDVIHPNILKTNTFTPQQQQEETRVCHKIITNIFNINRQIISDITLYSKIPQLEVRTHEQSKQTDSIHQNSHGQIFCLSVSKSTGRTFSFNCETRLNLL